MNTLIHSDNTWALWAILVGVAALSIWLEQRFRWAAKVTGCVIALIAMMLFNNSSFKRTLVEKRNLRQAEKIQKEG